MPRWEVPALWLALAMGLGVLGYTAWGWPLLALGKSAEATGAAAATLAGTLASPSSGPTGDTPPALVPWLDPLAQPASAPAADRLLAVAPSPSPAMPVPLTPPSATDQFIVGLAHVATPDASAIAPLAVNLRRQARQAAVPPEVDEGGATAAPFSPGDTGLPLFPGALPVPAQSARTADGGAVVTLTTQSPLATVVNFYRQGLPEGTQAERSVISSPAHHAGLDVREIDTRQRTLRRVQVGEVDATVYIRLSLIRTP